MRPCWPKGKRCFSITTSKGLTTCKHLSFPVTLHDSWRFSDTLHNRRAGQIHSFLNVLENPLYNIDLHNCSLVSAFHSDIPPLNALGAVDTSLLVSWRHRPFQLNCSRQQPHPWREIFEKTSCYNFISSKS